jgi:predicted AlkP superfamily phosphohydrolase/phosphomutase
MGTNYFGIKKKTKEEVQEIDKHWDNIRVALEYRKLGDIIEEAETLKEKENQLRVHLGKSSAGWRFLFNHNNWKYYGPSEKSIREFMNSCETIINEYGKEVDIDEFWETVHSKKNGWNMEQYSQYEIDQAIKKRDGLIEDPLNLTLSVWRAQEMYNEYKAHDWYEVHEYQGENIDKLPYRFSDCTEFS